MSSREIQIIPTSGGTGARVEGLDLLVSMTVEESRPILDWLLGHATRYDFTYRHAWSQGDVVIWDNRCTLHYAVHDYGDAPRVLHRLTIKGENFC